MERCTQGPSDSSLVSNYYFFVNDMSPVLQATSLLSEFRNASQLLNPMSLLKFDAVEIRSSKEGKHEKMKEKVFHTIL